MQRRIQVAIFGAARAAAVIELLDELGIGHQEFGIAELDRAEADPAVLAGYSAVLVLSEAYPTLRTLSKAANRAIDRYLTGGGTAYVEFATAAADPLPPAIAQPQPASYQRIVVTGRNRATAEFEPGDLFEEHQSWFLPVVPPQGAQVLLSYAKVAGVYNAVFGLPPQTSPALLSIPTGRGRLVYATTALSNFARGSYTLGSRWRVLARNLLVSLLPATEQQEVDRQHLPLRVHTSPRVWIAPDQQAVLVAWSEAGATVTATVGGAPDQPATQPVPLTEVAPGRFQSAPLTLAAGTFRFTVQASSGPAQRTATADLQVRPRADKYREMVDRAMAWYTKAGMLYNRPDGSAGVAEGLVSELGTDGRHQFRERRRGDCYVETAYAYARYAELTGEARYSTIAKNIMGLVLSKMQIPERSFLYGSFVTREYYPVPLDQMDYLFGDDEGWISLGALLHADRIDDDNALRQALRGTEALQRTANTKTRLQSEFLRRDPRVLAARGWKFIASQDIPSTVDIDPHWQSMPQAAMLYAYAMTKHQPYLDSVITGLDHMLTQYPRLGIETSRTAASSRFLLPLAGAYQYTGDERYRTVMLAIADWLTSHQDPETGAISEWDGHNPASNEAYGTTENSIFQTNGDPLTDQLYTTGFLAMNLHVAYQATGDEVFLTLQRDLLDYLARAQITSADPLLDGCWMRAFDFRNWEYYGSSADVGWGPYAVETGWLVAPIVIGAMFHLDRAPRFFPDQLTDRTELVRAVIAEFDAIQDAEVDARPTGPYQPDPATVLLMHFDDPNDLGKDSGQHALRGTLVGDGVGYLPRSVLGGSVAFPRFGGASSHIAVNDARLDAMGSAFTVEAWIRPDRLTVAQQHSGVISKSNYSIWLRNGLLYGEFLHAGGWATVQSGRVIPAEHWSHVALTYDGAKLVLWVNAQQVTTATLANARLERQDTPFTIGAHNPAWQDIPFHGAIAELRISSTARTAAEFNVQRP